MNMYGTESVTPNQRRRRKLNCFFFDLELDFGFELFKRLRGAEFIVMVFVFFFEAFEYRFNIIFLNLRSGYRINHRFTVKT